MGIIIRHITLSINLPSTRKPIEKPLILSVIRLYLYYLIIREKLADRSNYTLKST